MLDQKKRIIVGFIYFILLTVVFYIFIDNPFKSIFSLNNDISIIYFTGALFLILGKYIIEPYFTKPTDSIVNSISIILALTGINDRDSFIFFYYVYYLALIILIFGIICIITKDSTKQVTKFISVLSYYVCTLIGQSKILFSIVYLLSVYTYFWNEKLVDNIIIFSLLLLYWIVIVFFDFLSILWLQLEKIFSKFKIINNNSIIGTAIGCENPFLYKVECDSTNFTKKKVNEGSLVLIETRKNIGQLGVIIKIDHLLNKKWMSVYLLTNDEDDYFTFDIKNLKYIDDKKNITDMNNNTYLVHLDQFNEEIQYALERNIFYQNKDNFVGYVTTDSDIYTVNISILTNNKSILAHINDGAIINCLINNNEVRYQVINGKTKKEHLQNYDSFGYTIAVARKLGNYDESKKELLPATWMPEIFTPVFVNKQEVISEERLIEIAKNSIGRLPKTDLEVPIKNIHEIVTHNSAILGILGIGKSCLTYELIKKIIDEEIKIICIDITNEYAKELIEYIKPESIKCDDESIFNSINSRYDYIHRDGNTANFEKSGNKIEYTTEIRKDLLEFFFSSDNIPDDKKFNFEKNIRIYNPDYHKASKGSKVGFNVIISDLSQAEKTRIIVEEVFKILMKVGIPKDKKAKVLIVFEEAHSLIPEWNSVSNEGDKSAVNGTAKVILQGRKYGLGCFVITQRTANVSKSILNQCNTIFALRVFDDTGKTFLENYIGRDYTSTLPSLEERHAIIIGKGMKLKQPVIIELNNKDLVQKI